MGSQRTWGRILHRNKMIYIFEISDKMPIEMIGILAFSLLGF